MTRNASRNRAATGLAQVEVTSREELRAWLAAHHAQAESVWLVTYKKSAGERYLPYAEVVEEALCFGWVDSLPREVDADRTMRLLSPRKPGSAWSKANKARVEKLTAAGLMTAAGLEKVNRAKSDGTWTALDAVEALEVPPDLAQALADRPPAAEHFAKFPPSSKRLILEWVQQAKRPETRRRRILETAERAAKNERANHYRQP